MEFHFFGEARTEMYFHGGAGKQGENRRTAETGKRMGLIGKGSGISFPRRIGNGGKD